MFLVTYAFTFVAAVSISGNGPLVDLKDKKTYKNTTVSSNDGFSIYAKSSVVSTSTKTITYGDYSFNRGLVSNSTDGIKITANSDNIQFNVYYTVSTNNSFKLFKKYILFVYYLLLDLDLVQTFTVSEIITDKYKKNNGPD